MKESEDKIAGIAGIAKIKNQNLCNAEEQRKRRAKHITV